MPYALVIVGLILIVSGVRDTHLALGSQLKSDLTGDNNFTRYALAIFAVGALGYIDKLRPASTAFLALIVISLVLSNRGVFNKLSEAIEKGPEAPPASEPTKPLTTADKLGIVGNAATALNPAALLGKFIGQKIGGQLPSLNLGKPSQPQSGW